MLTIAVTVGFIRLKNSIATALVIVNVQCVCVCLDLVCGLNASLFNRVKADNYVDSNILLDGDVMVSER